MSTSLSDASTYIATFNRSQFGVTLAAFLLPAIILGGMATFMLHWSWFKYEYAATFWARFTCQCVRHPARFEKILPILMIVSILINFGGITMFIVFAAMLMAWVNTMIGVTTLLIGLSILTLLHAFLRAKNSSFRASFDWISYICIAIGGACWMAFELYVVFVSKPYDFTLISSVFLSFNVIPIANLAFLLIQGPIRDAQEYDSFDRPVLGSSASTNSNNQDRTAALAAERAKLPLRCFYLYASSWIPLIAYMFIIAGLSPTMPTAGVITVAIVIVMDFTSLAAVLTERVHDARIVVAMLTLGRALVVVFGDSYFMIGHSIVYLGLCLMFGKATIDHYFPIETEEKHRSDMMKSLTDQTSPSQVVVTDASSVNVASRHAWRQLPIIQKLHENVDTIVLVVLNCAFLADVLADGLTSTQALVSFNGTYYHQYLYGVIAVFAAIILLGLALTYRFYALNDKKLDWKARAVYIVISCFSFGFGGFLFGITKSTVIISYAFFLPPLVGIFAMLFESYRTSGYRVLSPPQYRTPSMGPFWKCFWSKGLPYHDYLVISGGVAFWILLGGLGLTISIYNTPSWVGWVSTMSILILITTFIPLYEYFQILEFSVNFFVQLSVSFVALTVMLVVLFVTAFKGTSDNSSVVLLFVFFMYPTLILAGFAVYYWRDNNWEISRFVVIVLGIVTALIVAFLLIVTIAFSPWTSGAAALLVFVLSGYVAVMLGVWRSNRYFLPPAWKWSGVIAVLLTLAYGIALGFQASSGFAGFSVIWAVLMAYLGIQIVTLNRGAKLENNSFIWSPTVFPVYQFSPKPGMKDSFTRNFEYPCFIYAFFGAGYIWGALAVWFVSPPWIGAGISSIFVVWAYTFTVSKQRLSAVNLAEAADFLVEGSPAYREVLSAAIAEASSSHLQNRVKSVLSEDGQYEGQGAGPEDSIAVAMPTHRASVAASVEANSKFALALLAAGPDGLISIDAIKAQNEFELNLLLVDSEDSDGNYNYEEFERRLLSFYSQMPWSFIPQSAPADAKPDASPDLANAALSVRAPVFTIDDVSYTRHSALIELMRRHRQFKRMADAENMFWLHATLAFVQVAADRRSEEDRLIQKMLISSGYNNVDMKFILTLDVDSPQRRLLATKLADARRAEEVRQAEADRRRKEDMDAQRVREEEMRRKQQEEAEIAERAKEESFTRDRRRREQEELARQQDLNRQKDEAEKREIAAREAEIKRKAEAAAAEKAAREKAEAQRVAEARRVAEAERQRIEDELRASEARAQAEREAAAAKRAAEEKARAEAAAAAEQKRAEQARLVAGGDVEFKEIDFVPSAEEQAEGMRAGKRVVAFPIAAGRSFTDDERQLQAELAARFAEQKVADEAARAEAARVRAENEARRRAEEEQRQRAAAAAREKAAAEAKAKAEEAQRQADAESARLQAIEAARRAQAEKEAKAKAENSAILARAASNQCCTSTIAPGKPILQKIYFCVTCNLERSNNKGICASCKDACHQSHRVIEGGEGMLLCDCPSLCNDPLTPYKCQAVVGVGQRDQLQLDRVATAIKTQMCVRALTGKVYPKQNWYECITCNLTKATGLGVCESCRNVCHAGHELRLGGEAKFFCDCSDQPGQACTTAAGFKAPCLAFISSLPDRKPIADQRAAARSKIDESTRQREAAERAKRDAEEQARRKAEAEAAKPSEEDNQSSADSTVSRVRKQIKQGTKWTDPDWQGDKSLFKDPRAPKNAKWKQIEWKRPEEIGMKNTKLKGTEMQPDDIKQGGLGDCWFLSAIAVMCKKPEVANRIFTDTDLIPSGVYTMSFFSNRQPVQVCVDDRLPVFKGQQALAFAKCREKDQMWVPMIEKAFAKLYGTYEAIEGGWVDQALADLTGGIAMNMSIKKMQAELRSGALWKKLVEYRDAGYLMGCGTPAGSDSVENASPTGIVQGHAYSLLDLQEVDDIKLVRARNPWGTFEWAGKYSDGDEKSWTERMKKKLNYVKSDDGAFWIEWSDFTVNFEDIYVCRFFDAPKWITTPRINGAWRGDSAGGCSNYDSFANNPQYAIKLLTSTPTDVVINLIQADTRGSSNAKNFAIAIEVYSNKGNKCTKRICGKMMMSNPESYVMRREVLAEGTLQPSAVPYTLQVSTFYPKEERDFILEIYSSQPIEVKQL